MVLPLSVRIPSRRAHDPHAEALEAEAQLAEYGDRIVGVIRHQVWQHRWRSRPECDRAAQDERGRMPDYDRRLAVELG
jgi:hypothetical protein